MEKVLSKIQKFEEKDEPSGVRYLYQNGIRYNDNEGLIFTSENKCYKPDFCISLKKWKWPKINTVDFLVRLSNHKSGSTSFLLYVMAESNLLQYREVFFNSQCTERLINDLSGQKEAIIQCYYDYLNQGEWRYYKISSEKKPSNVSSILQQFEVITENITHEELLKVFQNIRFTPAKLTQKSRNNNQVIKSYQNHIKNSQDDEEDIVHESPVKKEETIKSKKRKYNEIDDGSPETEYITIKRKKVNPIDEGSSPFDMTE